MCARSVHVVHVHRGPRHAARSVQDEGGDATVAAGSQQCSESAGGGLYGRHAVSRLSGSVHRGAVGGRSQHVYAAVAALISTAVWISTRLRRLLRYDVQNMYKYITIQYEKLIFVPCYSNYHEGAMMSCNMPR